jgi:hypothetical protein
MARRSHGDARRFGDHDRFGFGLLLDGAVLAVACRMQIDLTDEKAAALLKGLNAIIEDGSKVGSTGRAARICRRDHLAPGHLPRRDPPTLFWPNSTASLYYLFEPVH